MSEVQEIFETLIEESTVRTGFSDTWKSAFVVASDLRRAINYAGNVDRFVSGLVNMQAASSDDEEERVYVGFEPIQTPGGVQRMRVLYKRGVFHLLMRSDLPKAVELRDRLFDLLEELDRRGYVISNTITSEQLQALQERCTELSRKNQEMACDQQGLLDQTRHAEVETEYVTEEKRMMQLELDACRRKLRSFNVPPPTKAEIFGRGYRRGSKAGV